jgi:hypothetical protein
MADTMADASITDNVGPLPVKARFKLKAPRAVPIRTKDVTTALRARRYRRKRNIGSARPVHIPGCVLKPGQSGHPLYGIWRGMLTRCYDKSQPNYGGIGVSVCQRWHDFTCFVADMTSVGPRPSRQHSIDRWPNPAGNYESGNVRWATPEQQGNNKRTNRFVVAFGLRATQAQWARMVNTKPEILRGRLKRGWSADRALNPQARPLSSLSPLVLQVGPADALRWALYPFQTRR